MPQEPPPPVVPPEGSASPAATGPSIPAAPLAITRRGVWLVLWGAVLTSAWLVGSGVMLDPFFPTGWEIGPVQPNTTTAIQSSLPYRGVLPFLRVIPLFGVVLLTASPRDLRADRLATGMVALVFAELAACVAIDPGYVPFIAESEPTLLWITIGQTVLLAVWGSRVARRLARGAPSAEDRWGRIGLTMRRLAVAIPVAAAIYDFPPLFEMSVPRYRLPPTVNSWIFQTGPTLRIIGAIGLGSCLCVLVIAVRRLTLELATATARSTMPQAFPEERPERIATVGLAIALAVLAIHAASRTIDLFRSLENARFYEELKDSVPAGPPHAADHGLGHPLPVTWSRASP